MGTEPERHSDNVEQPARSAGRGDFGLWDPQDEPTDDVVHPFGALNQPSYIPANEPRRCVCEHLDDHHMGHIVPVGHQAKADFARLLGACRSCRCPRWSPSHVA